MKMSVGGLLNVHRQRSEYNHIMKYIIIILLLLLISSASADELDDVILFISEDQTDTHEYLPWYSCGHFARDLARNASEHNISIGSVILSNHPVFRGKWNSHIMNYFTTNGSIKLIEPRTDQIMNLNDTMYGYYRLYPDGTQVPSNRNCNLAHTGVIK